MSTLVSTFEALGKNDALIHCQSRSLRLTRYARPEFKDETRKAHLAAVVVSKGQRYDEGLKAWRAWLDEILPTGSERTAHLLHARLEARLLINMGGTVLENAGLQIDRFGTAFIPGAAIKACARRTALAALRQWCETGIKPDGSSGDALAPTCEAFATPGDFLLTIVRVFGCSDLEWSGYNEHSTNDLAWACGDNLPADRNPWPTLRDKARAAFNTATSTPEDSAPTRRGAIAFLPAYPHSRPAADLELDVLTSHHTNCYGSTDPQAVATDDENPIPVYFPAVAAATVYTFVLLPVGPADQALLDHARTWLKTGLEVFGLGAKTSAGYGYFTDVTAHVVETEIKAAELRRRADEEAAAMARKAADVATRKEREAHLSTLTPADREDALLANLATDWGRLKPYLTKFSERTPEQQAALLRWFAGPGKDRWLTDIKPGAANGKKPWSQIIGAVHAAKKAHRIDLP